MTKNPTEGNNFSDENSNSHGRDDRRGARPRTNSGEGKYRPREGGYDRDNRSGSDRPREGGYNRDNNRSGSGGGYNSDRPRYGQGQGGGYNRDNNRGGGDRREGGYNRDNRSNSGGGYNSDRPRRDGGDFKPRQDYRPRENRDGQSGSSYQPRENRYNNDRSSGRGDSPYPRRESVRPSEGGESGGYNRDRAPREGGYNRDNNRGDRPREGGYNRDNRGGGERREGGYNRDNNRDNRNGGYNRDNNRGGGFNNRNRGGSDNRPRREGEAGDRRNPIANKIRSAYYNSYKNDEEGGGRGNSRDSFRQRDDRRAPRKEHAPNYQLPADENASGISRLNKYIANSGICSRREADKLIEQGLISVNGKVISELGYKVNKSDEVRYEGRLIRPEKMVYVLLNKPKDFITTTEDPDERRTVMNLVSNACHERIYPVGRLDRNTTGLLLFTNDGDLAKRLTHPSHNISKIYQVELDRPLSGEDFDTIKTGFQLEDGKFRSDDLAYIDPSNRAVVGIEIHEGRNRLVRRVFEHFGYKVFKLDRVLYAGLTKKDLPRGNWRYLTEKEVLQLKYKQN